MHNPVEINVDFSNLEKRVVEQTAKNVDRLIAASHIDLHIMAAAKMFGVMYSNVTKSQREEAKRRNFAIVYSPGADLSELIPDGETLSRIFTPDELAEHCKSAQVGDANALAVALQKLYSPPPSGRTVTHRIPSCPDYLEIK